MEDRAFIDILTDLANHIAASGKGILDDPVRFRSLFLDFSGNQYKAEARIFREFLSSGEAHKIETADGVSTAMLKAITERFHEESRFDPGDCEMAVYACAWFMGLIDKEAFEAGPGAGAGGARAKAAGTIPVARPNPVLEGLEFESVDGRSITIKRYTGDAAAVDIPARIYDLPVTAIGLGAFKDCGSLTSITIPPSVTSIADGVFFGCKSLASVTIPPSVNSIGKGLFSNCSNLINVTIPPSVNSIGGHAFSNCVSLASITIPSSVNSIGDWAFRDCRSLASITIPSSVSSIGDWAFFHCGSLTSVALSRRTLVGEDAFPDSVRITYND